MAINLENDSRRQTDLPRQKPENKKNKNKDREKRRASKQIYLRPILRGESLCGMCISRTSRDRVVLQRNTITVSVQVGECISIDYNLPTVTV